MGITPVAALPYVLCMSKMEVTYGELESKMDMTRTFGNEGHLELDKTTALCKLESSMNHFQYTRNLRTHIT